MGQGTVQKDRRPKRPCGPRSALLSAGTMGTRRSKNAKRARRRMDWTAPTVGALGLHQIYFPLHSFYENNNNDV